MKNGIASQLGVAGKKGWRPGTRGVAALDRGKQWSALYLLILPTVASLLLFGYYPKVDVLLKSFYRWQPPLIEEFVGIKNYLDVFVDPLFWQSFKLIGILLVANLVKMWPAIFAAVALHRLSNERHRYVYQVLFVLPMVIPQLVWLLIWKSFFDADFGILNRVLSATGAMGVLRWLDGTNEDPGVMPHVAEHVQSVTGGLVDPLFGGIWSLVALGCVALALRQHGEARKLKTEGVVALACLFWFPVAMSRIWGGFGSLGAVAASLAILAPLLIYARSKLGSTWVWWTFLIGAGSLMGAASVGFAASGCALLLANRALASRRDAEWMRRLWSWLGAVALGGAGVLLMLGEVWVEPTGQFAGGSPAWLGNEDLVLPAIIFWGFPWVGVIGVLIYLAGLQQIPDDVYEAARLDGVGSIGLLFRIELPLIMTQVRINLIFMTIHTLTAYEIFLILLGSDGGPGNRGMVPGLYMFKKAFEEGQFGYAAALGMVLFVMILALTIVYNRYIKVEK